MFVGSGLKLLKLKKNDVRTQKMFFVIRIVLYFLRAIVAILSLFRNRPIPQPPVTTRTRAKVCTVMMRPAKSEDITIIQNMGEKYVPNTSVIECRCCPFSSSSIVGYMPPQVPYQPRAAPLQLLICLKAAIMMGLVVEEHPYSKDFAYGIGYWSWDTTKKYEVNLRKGCSKTCKSPDCSHTNKCGHHCNHACQ
jgi:hypothetical protein